MDPGEKRSSGSGRRVGRRVALHFFADEKCLEAVQMYPSSLPERSGKEYRHVSFREHFAQKLRYESATV